MNKRTILVSGGAGYIGSHVVKKLLAISNINNIVIIDNLSTGFYDTITVLKKLDIKNKIKFYNINISDIDSLENIFLENKIDEIIHFAAFSQVGESIQNPLKYYRNNTMNMINILEMAIKYKIKKFVFSSTAAVYGEPEVNQIPISEELEKKPINPYGYSKLMSEIILENVAKNNKFFKYIILRYFNVGGADIDGYIGECHEPETHLIPLIAKTALGKREKILVYGDDYLTKDGTCIRDYIHVEDLAEVHIVSLDYLEKNDSDIFNCGYGNGYSVSELIQMMKKVSQQDFSVEIAFEMVQRGET